MEINYSHCNCRLYLFVYYTILPYNFRLTMVFFSSLCQWHLKKIINSIFIIALLILINLRSNLTSRLKRILINFLCRDVSLIQFWHKYILYGSFFVQFLFLLLLTLSLETSVFISQARSLVVQFGAFANCLDITSC